MQCRGCAVPCGRMSVICHVGIANVTYFAWGAYVLVYESDIKLSWQLSVVGLKQILLHVNLSILSVLRLLVLCHLYE